MLNASAKFQSVRGASHQGGGWRGEGGVGQCYSREWVWNSRTELSWKVVGKGIVSMMTPLEEFYLGYIMF